MSSVGTQLFLLICKFYATNQASSHATCNRRFGPGILINSILYAAPNITHFGKFGKIVSFIFIAEQHFCAIFGTPDNVS